MANYKLVKNDDGVQHLTVVTDSGDVYGVDSNHARFNDILQQVLFANDYDIENLVNPAKGIVSAFAKLSTELSIRGNKLFYEGEELHDVLADKIVTLFDAGENYSPFVKFLEQLKTNPNDHSVENAYRWLAASDFVLDAEGNVIAYKGLTESHTSIHSGPAIRNGVPLDGQIPNEPGDVIEMDRHLVQFDPGVGCSVGLHAGTWEYASGFGRVVVKVKVRPKDIVSVPTDSGDQKMRVCRYEVIEEVTGPVGAQYDLGDVVVELPDDVDEDYELDEDYDDDEEDFPADGFVTRSVAVRKFSDGAVVVVTDNPRSSDGDHIGDIISSGSVGVVVGFDGSDYQVEFIPDNSDYEYQVDIASDSLELERKPAVDDPSAFKMQKSFPGMNGFSVTASRSSLSDTRLNHTRQTRDSRGRFVKKAR